MEKITSKALRIMLGSVIVLYILDQVTKWSIVFNYTEPFQNYVMEKTPIIQGSELMNFSIIRIHNTGVAFGFGNGTVWAPIVFLMVQVLALIGLIVLLRRGFFATRLLKIAWVCIMAGVLGNMTDRLLQGFFLSGAEQLSFLTNLSRGYVVDFLDFSFPWIQTAAFPNGYHWPAFNVADSCVCIAAALFFIASFFPPHKQEEKA
ncbi:MAG: signal peptidase II [Akkermansia sp.]